MNVIVPVALEGDTVAVIVTDCPRLAGFGVTVRAVVLG
jgi:hypothetical protein